MPAQSPQNVVLAPGAVPGSSEFNEACEKIFKMFDPPIVCGSYKDVRKKAKSGQQVEHFVVNGAFQTNRKKNISMKGFASYDQFKAFSYTVWDGQSKGTEHRFVTDKAKAFEKANPKATTNQRIDEGQKWTKESLSSKKNPAKGAKARARMKDPGGEDPDKIAEAAAKCLAEKAREHFAKQKVPLDKPTKNAWAGAKKAAGKAAKTAKSKKKK